MSRFPTFKKRPVGAIYSALPASKMANVIRWLTEEHVTYSEVQKRLEKEYNLRVSATAVSNFYRRFCAERSIETGAASVKSPALSVSKKHYAEIVLRIRLELSTSPSASAKKPRTGNR